MKCPRCEGIEIVKNGTYPVNYGEIIQKYKCKECQHYFIDSPHKHQKKPDLDEQILRLFNQQLPRRRIASILGIAKRTVDKRLKKLR